MHFFYVMESRVSGNCIHNIHKPCAPEKEINRKGNTVGKIAKRRQIRKSTQAYIRDLGEVSFHYVMFQDKENSYLSSEIHRVSFGGIS